VSEAGTLDHHVSHRSLLRVPGSQPYRDEIDAIIVPTTRHPAYLAEAARLAQQLGCTLLTLHSKEWTSAEKAALRIASSIDYIAIDVGDAAQLRLPRWETSRLLAKTVFAQRKSDLSAKRNLGLALSHMLGWSRVLFLDDDITELNAADVRQASGLLDTYNAVGLHVAGFPDNSVVCHAYRQAGGGQQSFIGGGALVVQVDRCSSFFPEIYNDDWFFLLDGDKGLQPVAVTGRVRQYPYDPFRNPDRARAEELGDVLAEGIYWLLDQDKTIKDATREHWTQFLRRRKQFIEHVLDMVKVDLSLKHDEKQRRIAALKGSLGRLALITPELCESYLLAWANDHKTWQRHVQELRPVEIGTDRRQRAWAVAQLTLDGSPRLTWRRSGRSAPIVRPSPVVISTSGSDTRRMDPAPAGVSGAPDGQVVPAGVR
jgi:hypothetical protein